MSPEDIYVDGLWSMESTCRHVLTGRGNGLFNLGRHIKYPKEAPLANLHVAMMNQLGVPAEKFADSNGKLLHLADL